MAEINDKTGLRTVAEPGVYEGDRVKGSRFVTRVERAATVDAALAVVAEARATWPDATHHCWAWRGDGRDAWRYADDGEPAGSAGRPILAAIDGRGLAQVVVVVVRWFGGTKLGVGGLVRAYGDAAAWALEAAGSVFEPFTTRLTLRFAYGLSGTVQSVLTAHAVAPEGADYGGEVCLHLRVPDGQVPGLIEDLIERTAGRLVVER